jgi:hypothetical protein
MYAHARLRVMRFWQIMIGSTTALVRVLPSTVHAHICAKLKRLRRAIAGKKSCLSGSNKLRREHDVASLNHAARKPEQGTLAGPNGWAGAAVAETMAAYGLIAPGDDGHIPPCSHKALPRLL